MSKRMLVDVPYGVLIEVTVETLPYIMQAKLYDRQGATYKEVPDKSIELIMANESDFGEVARENHYKKESEKYSKYWCDENTKTRKLEKELSDLKEQVLAAGLTPKTTEEK